jgi:hypothetical protein
MKRHSQLRQVPAAARTGRSRIASGITRYTLPVAALLALVASALLTGATFATAADLLPLTLPVLLVGWLAAVGATFALPLVIVRGVVALFERFQ